MLIRKKGAVPPTPFFKALIHAHSSHDAFAAWNVSFPIVRRMPKLWAFFKCEALEVLGETAFAVSLSTSLHTTSLKSLRQKDHTPQGMYRYLSRH